MKNKFVARPYVNEIGQELLPGDKVVCVTTGYSHSVSTFTGIYEGVTVDSQDRVRTLSISGIPKRKWNYDYKTRQGSYTDYIGKTALQRKRAYKIV